MFIGYASSRVEREFKTQLHPQTRFVVAGLASFCSAEGLPAPFVTMVGRTRREQEELYWHEEEAHALKAGVKISEALARERASKRPSWHMRLTAVDLRTVGPDQTRPHYTPAELVQVLSWLEVTLRVPRNTSAGDGKPWEFLARLHGTGPHIHIARRDFSYRHPETTPC